MRRDGSCRSIALFSGPGIQQSRDFFAENVISAMCEIRPVDYAVSMFMHNSRVKGLAG